MVVEPWVLVLTVGVVVASYVLVKRVVKRYRFVSLINQLPGPPPWPLIGNVLDVIMVPRNRMMGRIADHVNKYCPMYRTWNGPIAEVHILKPEHAEVVLGGMKHIEKGIAYKFLHPWLGQGLLTSFGTKWHTHRKMITPTFHFKILESFCNIFVEKCQIMIKKLEEELALHPGDEGFDLYPFITRCTLDIICETAMGVEINAQEETHSEYVAAVVDISELTLYQALRPWLHSDFIFYKTRSGKQYKHCLQVLHGFTEKVIKERKAEFKNTSENGINPAPTDDVVMGSKKRLAFLDLLLQDTTAGDVLSDLEIREEVDTFMFEGHDTTTTGTSWALLLLGTHLDVQEKVIQELDEILDGSDRPITMRDLGEMKYLERVIKETLRLYPSVPFILRTLEEDTQLGKYLIPSGCMVTVHIYHVHRDPEHFPNPEVFDPDNFLPDRVQGRHPYAYIPFSAGPRNCIGQKFALLEEKTLLASILRHFRVRTLDKMEDVVPLNGLMLKPESGVRAVLSPR